jgi:hypothetical protein
LAGRKIDGGWVGKVSKAKKKKKKKKKGRGRGENKVVKKNWDQGWERANKKSEPWMAQG